MNVEPSGSPVVDQNWLFQRLRWRMLRNGWHALFDQSAVRPITIVICSLIVWAFVFTVSFGGFLFLRRTVNLPLGGDLVGTVFDVLFLILGVFLVFSTGLVLYSSLFNSSETSFLLSRPTLAEHVFAFKLQGAVAFSSWAFLLLGAPLLIAYGLVRAAPWYFYGFLPLFFLGFVLVPGSLGGLFCLLVVNFIPKQRKQVFLLTGIVVVALFGWWIVGVVRAARPGAFDSEAVNVLLDRFAFTRSKLAPSHWVARGLSAAAGRNPGVALYNLLLIWSNGLFLYLITTALAARLYRRGYNRLATGGDLRRRYGGHWMDNILAGALPFVRPTTRLLIVKDFRTFRRDPQQWAQILIFSALMALYSSNIRRLFITDIDWMHQNLLSALNVFTIALLLCTYTGRFVYPLLSLEGRKFWVLGLLPLEREQLLWGKFAFATTMVFGIAETLVVLSDLMLLMPVSIILLHALMVGVLAFGLSGLSVGLGALLSNFRETDPSKIAAGFGGTLNVVASLFFLIATYGLMALPWHLLSAGGAEGPEPLSLPAVGVVTAGVCGGLMVGFAAVVGPMSAGAQAFRRMEF